MSVWGHTVAVIGGAFEMAIARDALVMLLRGSEHKTVYRFLERSGPTSRRTKWDSEGSATAPAGEWPSVGSSTQPSHDGRPRRRPNGLRNTIK